MDLCEQIALRSLFSHLKEEIQPQWLADSLYSRSIINEGQLRFYKNEKNNRVHDLVVFIIERCPLDKFLDCLGEIGRDDLVPTILKEVEDVRLGPRQQQVLEREQAKYGHSFYNYSVTAQDLQRLVYEGSPDLQESLDGTIKLFSKLHRSLDTNGFNRMVAFIETRLGMDRIYKSSTEELHTSELFSVLDSIKGKTSFAGIAEMVYDINFAEALARRGRAHEALPYARRCLQRMDLEHPCRFNTNALYAIINIFSLLYYETQDPKFKAKALYYSRLACKQVEFEKWDTRKFWRRMLKVKEVYLLLGIDVSSGDMPGVTIADADLQTARECLTEVRQELWDGIEPRRKMIYYRAMSKYYIWKNKFEDAIKYVKAALKIARAKDFKVEVQVFDNIISSLQDNLDCFEKGQQTRAGHQVAHPTGE